MLCEVSVWGNLFTTWLLLNLLGILGIFALSGPMFWSYYQNATYDKWRFKSNPQFPSVNMVADEIKQTLKGMLTATLCPTLALHLSQIGYSKAYCGLGTDIYFGGNTAFAFAYFIFSFFLIWIGTDFYEFFYHRIGHLTDLGWHQHRHHHVFFNPSPFAVIADEYIDQFVRSLLLLILPLIVPINMDLLFAQYAIFFYGYGVYLHWGYELESIDAHHPWINTSFQHYCHHARSTNNKPYHTGFFFKIWDQAFGSTYNGTCFCCKCEQEKGNRSPEKWLEASKKKPDYSVLLSPKFWINHLFYKDNEVKASS